MKIGIDIDDTINKLINEQFKYTLRYFRKHNFNYKLSKDKSYSFFMSLPWTEKESEMYLKELVEDVILQVSVKRNAKKIINRLYDSGDEIYIITARSDDHFNDPKKTSEEWLKCNGIKYTDIVVSASNKGKICKDLGIEVMIEDNPKNIKDLVENNIRTIMMRNSINKNEYNVIKVRSWNQIYREITKIKNA